ncbi:MAG: hypothetical protein J6Y29_06690 [Clostridiales bacterium]|nr:hypothetical protein [Clostridiales bacterium]
MKKNLRVIAVVVAAIVSIGSVNVFAEGKESLKSRITAWKPWEYFYSPSVREAKKAKKAQDAAKTNNVESKKGNKSGSNVAVQEDKKKTKRSRRGSSVGSSSAIKSVEEVVMEKGDICLHECNEEGAKQKTLDDIYIGEYRLKKNMNIIKYEDRNSISSIYSEDLIKRLSTLKINDDYTGSFKIGVNGEEIKFVVERQDNNAYVQLVSKRGAKLNYRYKLSTVKLGDKYFLIFDNICWEKSGLYGISKKYTKRDVKMGSSNQGFSVEVPHIGCPTNGEAKINTHFKKVLNDEYKELEKLLKNCNYYHAVSDYVVECDKNDILSVLRERNVLTRQGMNGSNMQYKACAEVFNKATGEKLSLNDILKGPDGVIQKFVVACYRNDSGDSKSVRADFGSTSANLEFKDADILNKVNFYVDGENLVFVLDVFDGSHPEVGKAVHKVNIEKNKNLFTSDFLARLKG